MKDDKERNYFSLKNHILEVPPSHAKIRLKSAPQKVNFLMAKSIRKSYKLTCSHKCPCTFHIVTHCCAVSFSRKTILCETNNIFYSLGNQKLDKTNSWSLKYIGNKYEVTLDSFSNFAYVSSYFHLKDFAWKRG